MFGLPWIGWKEIVNPAAFVVLFLLCVWYAYMTRKPRFRSTAGKKACFYSGVLLLYLAVAGPVGALSHHLFSAHMFSMAVAFIAAPPLILLGIPEELARLAFRPAFVRKTAKVLLHPLVSLFLFNTLFSFYHVPAIHETVMQSEVLHLAMFLALLASAFVMWMQLVPPLPEYERLSELTKIGYLLAGSVLITPACGLIIFAGKPLYHTFHLTMHPEVFLSDSPFSFLLPYMTPLWDQQLGGIIMKTMQEVIYGSILAYLFVRWYRKETAKTDPLPGERRPDFPPQDESERTGQE